MQIFSHIVEMGHEQVIFCYHKEAGLKAIIAIHNTNLGAALGGTRLFPYANDEDALKDVLRLSRAMTYKAACANIPVGGGKGVIIANPDQKTDKLFSTYGRFVENLQGRFITGQDVNISLEDTYKMSEQTSYIVGLLERYGGCSRATAIGINSGMKAAVDFYLGKKNLQGLKIAIQGVGKVGKNLCQILSEEEVEIFVSDPIAERLAELKHLYQVNVVDLEEIYEIDVDLFAPCALGGVINSSTIPKLKAKIIAGGANNQLENEELDSQMLAERNILYCPDYVINAGGLINVYDEMVDLDEENSLARVRNIGDTLMEVFQISQNENITTLAASKRLAENRFLGG
ncbi:Glu/Leu/Phe/Val dehydrogenase dimerization domain-containing protein [Anabaena azotica]|uniref:Glu/Leu/Phe/Val dehydrogenase dimerization domain-containing protein n=1 Tax=Anabaena azotica TaxID=197653 RepID=UPI0039A467C4